MIVTKENERLYPATWGYNAARITTELAKIVENNNGRVKYGHAALISNRTITSAIFEKEERIKNLKAATGENKKEIRAAAIKALEKEIAELKQIDNRPIRVTHTSYISFVLENNYYHFSMDDNPLFPFYYTKTPVKNGSYSADACSTEDKKTWLYDCFFFWDCSDADIKEAAQLIFNMLCNAPYSVIRRDSCRKRVSNYYNNGFHYETVYAPERIAKIDF